jgi:hypothetical protein
LSARVARPSSASAHRGRPTPTHRRRTRTHRASCGQTQRGRNARLDKAVAVGGPRGEWPEAESPETRSPR